ncbi:S-(hydroxymethyl)glutathione dehydrogenase/alcohol dehydrogenase [Cryobacterium sp. MP_M5]|uniref:alcohol dehydrogenase catalytic domain-containing protein n=1 Tax=unclassified Cryobacterium TaxID=2649013 RepID=UPI0018CBAA3A|nr:MULTISPECIES: Zn-dependent alcohol dehydrogenase [unclassified Cryobacterium]MBG6058225.1 S-(hydroxymethyl)glutathione dehydrogenase/alcohol dehydrogenase [Cryobacterium sp. MP_M3]MEC5176529.1 S-(hydroxymethyl)glutathione dehydrogenase/alcohol dehydrogenase [Cryobacterium sp. MP_M5]
MKAVVFDGKRVHYSDVVLAAPGPGEVLVDIAAAGVCHSDLHVIRSEWSVPLPLVMGHEGSGVVAAVGEGVTSLDVGDHVVLSWVPYCGKCRYCELGRPAQCELAATVVAPGGVLFDGTSRLSRGGESIHHYLGVSSFARQAVVPESGAIKVRSDAPLDLIALIGCAIATGVGAVRNTAQFKAGSTAAVIGCGGVGLSVIQGARLEKASKILAVDVSQEKLELARKLGATSTLLVTPEMDVPAEMKKLMPEGLDYVFDAIGKIATTEQAIKALGLGGCAVVVGLPPTGQTARFDPLILAEADQRILGCNYGSTVPQRDIPRLVDEMMSGDLDLESMISARRPLAEAEAALADLDSGIALRQLLIP